MIEVRGRIVLDALPISMVEVEGHLREGVSILFDREPTLELFAFECGSRVFWILAIRIGRRDLQPELEIHRLRQRGEIISRHR